MKEIPYINYNKEEMILRDFLALHRSQMANERTLLSYLRTALALIAGGITLVKLTTDIKSIIIGWMLLPIGVSVGIVGVYRFISIRRDFGKLDQSNGENM